MWEEYLKTRELSTREDTLRLSCKGQVADTVRKNYGRREKHKQKQYVSKMCSENQM